VRSEEGFSLIEMMVTLAVMALVAGYVVINVSTSSPSLAAETDRFSASLSAARDLALIENRVVTVEISTDGYRTLRRSLRGAEEVVPLTPWNDGTSVAPANGRLPLLVTFDPIGLADPASLVLNRNGRTQALTINPAGEIRRGANAS
jgi:general secretion pathway protein H